MTSRWTKCKQELEELQRAKNRTKVRVWFKAEHVFLVMKRPFGSDRLRYVVWVKKTNGVLAYFDMA